MIADLPAPLTRASEHLQFFDDYLTDTRLLLRKIRVPRTKQLEYRFVQRYPVTPTDLSYLTVNEIELDKREYEVLAIFEGNQLRYNRYFLLLETGETMLIEMFLNRELWNLILATIEFKTIEEMNNFAPPAFVQMEITQDEFFTGAKLVDADIEQVRRRINQTSN